MNHTPSTNRSNSGDWWNRQIPSGMPSHRYASFADRVRLPDPGQSRSWPDQTITTSPLWVPVDLRDGNQALAEPMDPERKRQFFQMMIEIGYKEIEVGYPSASRPEFDFVRRIVIEDLAPDDVTIVVFTPARRDLIERTIESVAGIRNEVVIHMYTATAPIWRDVVLGKTRAELRKLILQAGDDILELAGDLPRTRFEFSPEVFNLTEPEFALEICNDMVHRWDANPDRPVIINLPTTVEASTPNLFADQIEFMHRHLDRRSDVILSVHPHNDRGTGIATAELGILAGAQRVEGCIFGNGERTGNVDIATLALNLHSQGVDPMIDFSDIDRVRRVVEHCTRIPVHDRHPYVGDLVHTAFSGTHQDAIRKGFAEHRERAASFGISEADSAWRVPYLPVDPVDLGRTYDAVIRVNSQSGKGGIAHVLETEHSIQMPRRMQVDFSRVVQRYTDGSGGEITATELRRLFDQTYLAGDEIVTLHSWRVQADDDGQETTTLRLGDDAGDHTFTLAQCGPVDALTQVLDQLGRPVRVLSLSQYSLTTGNSSDAITHIEYDTPSGPRWASGVHHSTTEATLLAVMRAANAGDQSGDNN